MNQITSYVHIKNNQVVVNGNTVFSVDAAKPVNDFLSNVYKALGISYPKFHKMDIQCKLGFLCMEYVLQHNDFMNRNEPGKIAMVFSNSASSLETDRQHQQSISDKSNYFPSPAIFVYTLPNIVIGEIAIRHKITGENAFFVSEKIDAELLSNYSDILLENGSNAVVCGWTEVDTNTLEGFIFLVEKPENINKNSIFKPLNQSTIFELYNQ